MPTFVLNRNYPLQGFGHSINFIKGQPTWVPQVLVAGAVALGATSVDGEVNVADVLGPEPEVPVMLSADERELLLMSAFEQLEARTNNPDFREDFNAQGLPNTKALSKIVDFPVSSKERNEFWQKYRDNKAA